MGRSLKGETGDAVSESGSSLLLRVWRNPELCTSGNELFWDELVRAGRSVDSLARLGSRLARHNVTIPEYAEWHIRAAAQVIDYQQRSVRWEIYQLTKALEAIGTSFALLKGAAYLVGYEFVAKGRSFADLDILILKQDIDRVESALADQGWYSAPMDDYDRHYYRDWMHEIPPMRHVTRPLELDIHHTLVPPISRHAFPVESVWENVQPAENTNLLVLCPEDLTLHSVAQLFLEGEFHRGFRNLLDLDLMFQSFPKADPGYWSKLFNRAKAIGFEHPLFYGIRYTSRMLGTPVPKEIVNQADGLYPADWRRGLADWLFGAVLTPRDPLAPQRIGDQFASNILWARGHLIKMPLPRLVSHLARKSIKRWSKR